MHDRRLVTAAAAIALVVVLAAAFLLLAPWLAARGVEQLVEAQLGRAVTVRGGSHLDLAPLALRLDDVAVAGPEAADDSLIIAREASLPVGLGQLFGGAASLAGLSLVEPEIALLINERGEANWDVPDLKPGAPLSIGLEQARLRYFDARNSQSLELAQVDGRLDLGAAGDARFSGTAVINGRLVRIDAELKSLARVNADGSPFEVSLAADDGQATFSGRLATAKVLSLAGPVSLASDRPAAALRLLGLPVPPAARLPGAIAIDGALDTAGRALAIRNATLSLGAFQAAGELGADLRGARPKLQANLVADQLWLDPLLPTAGAANGDWGRAPLPFALLRDIDIEAAIKARSLSLGAFSAGASSLKVTLGDGKLEVVDASQIDDAGTLNFTARADATALPPSVGLSIAVSDAPAQPLLGVLAGMTGLTGTGGFRAELSATGTTQEELAGTLKGTASADYADGSIAGADLTGLALLAKQKILDGWAAAPGNTPFTRLAGEAKIADGIATFRDATLEGPLTSFTLEGLVDVLRQAIAVSASAVANGQPLLPVPVIAKGPWAKPRIYPDVANILTDPAAGFARLQDGTAMPLQGN